LAKIENIDPKTSLIGEKIQDIAQMVELMNKAQDTQTALKLSEIIILKLEESILEFDEVTKETENFNQYLAIVQEKIYAI
jgi:hypothetical protein